MKRIVLLLFCAVMLLVGCTVEPNNEITTNSTANTTVQSEIEMYPGEVAYGMLSEFEESLPAEIFTTTGEENGLVEKVYLIEGVVDRVELLSECAYIIVSTDNGEVAVIDTLSMLTSDASIVELGGINEVIFRKYYPLPNIGEKIKIVAEYQGMSDVFNMATFLYADRAYLTEVVLLSLKYPEDTDDSNVPEDTDDSDVPDGPSGKPYEPGMYKVGSDLPAGEYLFMPTGSSSGYVCASLDSNQNDIVENENISGPFFMTVADGQYLQAKRCTFVIAQEHTLTINEDGSFADGMYRVGEDIPAGEYKLKATEDTRGYWCIYNNSEIPFDIVDNQNFEGSTYVTVREGQYLLIKRCIAIPAE